MRILASWLGDYIEWTGTAPEMAALLTEAGLPVASIEEVAATGTSFRDAILDVEVTSNRGDCLSHLGIAREIAAATGQPFRPVVQPDRPATEGPEEAAALVPVEVEVPDLCPAYAARVLLGASNAGPTPPWIARRLELLGQRAVNPVADVTNFLALARGQPLHAFDRGKLRGGRIVVRTARRGETLVTLDGRKRDLPEGILVIADAERPVAVAGVMGGQETEVGPGTTEVVLESARFAAPAVRRSAAALGLATEASSRFSRRVDPAECEVSSLRAMALLLEACGGRSARGASRAGPEAGGVPPRGTLRLRFARLHRILGIAIPPEEVLASLTSLSVAVAGRDDEGVDARPPSWRGDILIEEDLVEEVARSHGYGRIPVTVSLPVRPVPVTDAERSRAAAREALVAAGFHEALTLPFVGPGPLDDASPWTGLPAVRVDNPTRAEEPLLRRSLLGPLLRCLERNRARGVRGVRLFELGAAFLPRAEEARPEERRLLSGALEGAYADARGAVEAVADALGLASDLRWEAAPPAAPVGPLDGSRTARILLGRDTAGWAGEVRAEDLDGLGVHREGLHVAAFELDFGLLEGKARHGRPVRPVPVHPEVERDLAVVFPSSVPWSAVEEGARKAGGPLLRRVELFDDYRGRGVPPAHRSLAFRLAFGAADRTLRGEEVDGAVEAVVRSLAEGLGGRLRG